MQLATGARMNAPLKDLLRLQGLEFDEVPNKKAGAEIADLRSRIPRPILDHYDRLRARGKKGIALVRNQGCTGCHMKLPIGTVNVVMHGEDIQLCDSCGRYLCLPEPEAIAEPAAEPAAPAKPARKPRKRKALADAA